MHWYCGPTLHYWCKKQTHVTLLVEIELFASGNKVLPECIVIMVALCNIMGARFDRRRRFMRNRSTVGKHLHFASLYHHHHHLPALI